MHFPNRITDDMHIAQVNIARMKDTLESEIMVDFVNALDEVNALSEAAKGFRWRLKGDDNDATAIRVFEDDYLIINLSVWEDISSLKSFVYSGLHLDVYRKKKKWFHKMKDHHMALWHVPEGHEPTPEEAKEKLNYLNLNGESEKIFTFAYRK